MTSSGSNLLIFASYGGSNDDEVDGDVEDDDEEDVNMLGSSTYVQEDEQKGRVKKLLNKNKCCPVLTDDMVENR